MHSYHFDIGDSSPAGMVGFCARITARDEHHAVAMLRRVLENLPDGHSVFDDTEDDPIERPAPGLEYLRIYFNPACVTDDKIDDVSEPDEDIVAELLKEEES